MRQNDGGHKDSLRNKGDLETFRYERDAGYSFWRSKSFVEQLAGSHSSPSELMPLNVNIDCHEYSNKFSKEFGPRKSPKSKINKIARRNKKAGAVTEATFQK